MKRRTKLFSIIYVLFYLLFLNNCDKLIKNVSNKEITNKWIEKNNGLEVKSIQSLTINNQNTLYAGTSSGLYKSTNGASSWNKLSNGLISNDIRNIYCDIQNTNILFVATWGGGIFKSEDGATWSDISSNLPDPRVFSISQSKNNPSLIFAGTETGLYRTLNIGLNWQKINSPSVPTPTLLIIPNNIEIIFIGLKWYGVYVSTNHGDTWSEKNNGIYKSLEGYFVSPTSLIYNPYDLETIYLSSEYPAIFKSKDSGEQWEMYQLPIKNGIVNCIVLNHNLPETIFVGTDHGIFKSSDGAKNWIEINDGLTNLDVRALIIDPKNPRIIYAGTMGGGVFKMILD